MSDMQRTRGITLQLLDIERVGRAYHSEISFQPWAMFETGNRTWVVCGEGVAWEVGDRKPLRLDLYPELGPNQIAIMPDKQAILDRTEVRALATGETIDLADLVRVFGHRLESNFWILVRTFEEAREGVKS